MQKEDLERALEIEEADFEFVGTLEDVTAGWSSYTYDVSWGDRDD
ncbi:hypothetical protein [Jidongwangia harbinensis]|nr:hypothetical protein [Jidongwangia harbinensis]